MTDEVQTEGFTRRFVKGPKWGYEFLCRSNDDMGEMARRAGRRRAYEIADQERVRPHSEQPS